MRIKIGSIVNLRAAEGASRRTKNRLREHGALGFRIEDYSAGSWQFDGQPAILLTSVKDTQGEPWSGWLPLAEIDEIP